jgi:hypothetical protein
MLLQSPIHLAHFYWDLLLKEGDSALDATCGQGKDSLFLAKKILKKGNGRLVVMDIQKEALEKTRALLEEHVDQEALNQVQYIESCHSQIDLASPNIFKLIVYNLGYLPGGNKELTTLLESSIQSFEKALQLLSVQGYLSITCYPGHPSGKVEKDGILLWAKSLPKSFTCCHHQWVNRSDSSPSLLLIQKN